MSRKIPETNASDLSAFDWNDLYHLDASTTSPYPITLEEYRRREGVERPRSATRHRSTAGGGLGE